MFFVLIISRLRKLATWLPQFKDVVEEDKSYLGAYRIRGKCGQSNCGKTILLGLLKQAR